MSIRTNKMNETEENELPLEGEPIGDLNFAARISTEVEEEPDIDEGELTRPWDPNLIRVEAKTFSVKQVLEMIDEGDLELQPEFQRRRVWTSKQKSLLIESLLLRIPLPVFYFSADTDGKLQVIDGLQRLSTIHDFVKGGDDGNRKFKLRNLEYLQEMVGKKSFDDLKGLVWSRRILQASLIANIVDPQTPPQVKLNIFGRLNRQGTPLSLQELRHAMSGERSRKFLLELSKNENFHLATRNSLRDSKRMHDIEVALRFCAFQLHFEDYSKFGSLSELLTATTTSIDSPHEVPDKVLDGLRKSFNTSMSNSFQVFGESGFRKDASQPINRALFEVWSYALSHVRQDIAVKMALDIRQISLRLLSDTNFKESVSLNTSDPARVNYRFVAVLHALRQLGAIDA